MDKLSISTILQRDDVYNKHNKNGSSGNNNRNNLDVRSLMTITNSYYDQNLNFTAEQIIKTNKEKREKILEVYNKYYYKCIEKIKLLNNQGKIDLIYEIPEVIPETPDYVAKFCVDYISNKLKTNYFDTYIMNPTTIFVTWKFIEANKEKLGAR